MPTPAVERQTTASALTPSLIRTLFPFLAGLLGTWAADKLGLPIEGEAAGAVVTVVIGYVYYVVARFLEVYGSDKWGYILGFRKVPVYTDPPATVVVRNETGGGDLDGVAGVAVLVGVVVVFLGGVTDNHDAVVTGAVIAVLGVVVWVLGQLIFPPTRRP